MNRVNAINTINTATILIIYTINTTIIIMIININTCLILKREIKRCPDQALPGSSKREPRPTT